MPLPITPWTNATPLTAKSLNLALYTCDGTADNPNGILFHAYRPILFESYAQQRSWPALPGGTRTTMRGATTNTTGLIVYDTAGYFGGFGDQPGSGYYQFKPAVFGSSGNGQTPGGWTVLSHFMPIQPKTNQTSVGADFIQTSTAYSGTRQLPSTAQDSCPFFLDLLNAGQLTWQPAVRISDSASAATMNAVTLSTAAGETPRMSALWGGVSSTSAGIATFTTNGVYNFTAPAGVTQITVTAFGAGAGGGAGNVSATGIQYGGGGGGGGGYSIGQVTVTPGNNYPVTVGAAGVGGANPGGAGGAGGSSGFSGDTGAVTAPGGAAGGGATTGGNGSGGAGGVGTSFSGGAGAAGATGAYGGGGGSSAGTGNAGNPGSQQTGGPAPVGGGPGGTGGTLTPTVIQHASHSSTSTSLTVTFSNHLQTGNGVVVGIMCTSGGGANITSITLNDGTTFTQDVNVSLNGLSQGSAYIYSTWAIPGGEISVTMHTSGSYPRLAAVAYEVAGMGTASVDANASSSSAGLSTSYTLTTTANAAPELWFTAITTISNNSTSISSPSGWTTNSVSANPGQAPDITCRAGYQIQHAAGSVHASGSLSPSAHWGACIATYVPSGNTPGFEPAVGPGGGGGGGFGQFDGGGGMDGQVVLTWTATAASTYGSPAVPTPYAAYSDTTTVGAGAGSWDVDVNSSSGIKDVVNYLSNPPVFRVGGATAASLASGTAVSVSFSSFTPDIDSYGGWAGSVSTYTVQRDGVYLAHGLVSFASFASGTRAAGLNVNGTVYWGPSYAPATGSQETHASKTQVLGLRAGDTVRLAGFQSSGSSQLLSSAEQSRFFLIWLGALGNPSLLTGQNANFEGGIGTWYGRVANYNSSVAASTAQAHTGTGCLAITSQAAGSMNATHCQDSLAVMSVYGLPVTQGQIVSGSAWFMAAASGRTCYTQIAWYDASGGYLTSVNGPTVADTTTGWVQAYVTTIAPLSAAYALLSTVIQSTGGASEVHYVDDAYLALSITMDWAPPDTTFRWQAGTPAGNIAGLMAEHVGNDLNFLVNKPYGLAYQTVTQAGFPSGGGASTAAFVKRIAAGALNSGSSTNWTTTVGSATTGTGSLIATVGFGNQAGTVATITDTKSNSYVKQYNAPPGSTNGRGLEVWRVANFTPLTISDTITVTLSATQDHGGAMILDQYTSLNAADASNYNFQSSASTNTSVSVTATSSDRLVHSAVAVNGPNMAPTVGSPFTATGTDSYSNIGGVGIDVRPAYDTSPPAGGGNVTANWSWASSHTAVAVAVGFPAPAPPASSSFQPVIMDTIGSIIHPGDDGDNYGGWQGGTALNPNPSFESAIGSTWSGSGGVLTQSAAQHFSGSNSGLLSPTGGVHSYISSPRVAVTQGFYYTASAYVYASASATNVMVNISWFDSSSAYISTTTGTAISLSSATWTALPPLTAQPVAGAAYANISVDYSSPPNTTLFYADLAQLVQTSVYVAPAAGWYLVVGEVFATTTAASSATVLAAVQCGSSGGRTPSVTPDWYQQLTATSTGAPGATVYALYYLLPGEGVTPIIQAGSYSAAYGTTVGTVNGGQINSHCEVIWVSE